MYPEGWDALTSTGTLTEEGDPAWIAAECWNVLLDPSQRLDLIPESVVSDSSFVELLVIFFNLFTCKETVHPYSVGNGDDDGWDFEIMRNFG